MGANESEEQGGAERAAVVSGMRPRPARETQHIPVSFAGIALLLAVCLSYLPSLSAGTLNYDDPWLITQNARFARGAWDTPWIAFTDLSRKARLSLGAEYLPLRDLLVWLEGQVFDRSPMAMHAISILLFAISALLFRRFLQRLLGPRPLLVETAAFLYALHPAHVESVAWLAGQKDVLALMFIAAALSVHAGVSKRATFLVPLLLLGACLSKSMSVAVLALLPVTDWYKKRAPDWPLYSMSAAVVALCLGLHLYVGRIVHMIAEPLGGSRLAAIYSMGPVWLRYLELCFWPASLSIEHVVPALQTPTSLSLAGYGVAAAFLMAGVLLRKRAPLVLLSFAWFFVPLAPVSQVVAPLQNHMADRYLWLSLMAPALWVGGLLQLSAERTVSTKRMAQALAISLGLVCAAGSFDRAITFSDSVLLFSDAARKADSGPRTAYQLAKALEEAGRRDEAIVAYRETLRRAPHGDRSEARRATNNLAKLLAAKGMLLEAEAVLREGYARFPYDAKMRGNLVKVLRGMGRNDDAEGVPEPKGLMPEELQF